MNPIDLSLTESVQGAGGAGFSVPIFRAATAIDQTTATPQGRAGAGIDYLADIQMDGLDPISAQRDVFDQEIASLNEWIAGVVEKGYDPRKIDYSDPNSTKVWLEFNKKKQVVKRLADNLRESNLAKREKDLFVNPKADLAEVRSKGFKPNLIDAVKQQNQMFSASGYDTKETYNMAMQEYKLAGEQLLDAYLAQKEMVKDNPDLVRKLEASYVEANAARRPPMYVGGLNEKEQAQHSIDRQNLALREKEFQLKKDAAEVGLEEIEEAADVFSTATGKGVRYTKTRLPIPEIDIASARGYTINNGEIKNENLTGIKITGYETYPIDKAGNPIISDRKGSVEVAGFRTFAVGSATKKGSDNKVRFVPVYINPDLTRNKHKGKLGQTINSKIDLYKQKDKSLSSTAIDRETEAEKKSKPKVEATQEVKSRVENY